MRDKPNLEQLLDHPALNPRKYVNFFAEWGVATNDDWGTVNNGLGSGFNTLSAENGAGSITNGGAANSYAAVMLGRGSATPDGIINPNKHPYFETRATLASNLGTAKRALLGFCSDFTAAAPAEFIGFRVTGTGNWTAVTRTGGVETGSATDTGIAAALNTVYIFVWRVESKGAKVLFEMWSDANPRVRVFGPVAHTANIPTTAYTCGLGTHNGADTNEGSIQVDYTWVYQLRQAA